MSARLHRRSLVNPLRLILLGKSNYRLGSASNTENWFRFLACGIVGFSDRDCGCYKLQTPSALELLNLWFRVVPRQPAAVIEKNVPIVQLRMLSHRDVDSFLPHVLQCALEVVPRCLRVRARQDPDGMFRFPHTIQRCRADVIIAESDFRFGGCEQFSRF